MTTRNQLALAESALRQHALAFPESYEEFPWGHLAVKVKGKAFLFMSTGKSDENHRQIEKHAREARESRAHARRQSDPHRGRAGRDR